MNQNEIHLSKHLWSIAVKLGGIYMELTIPFSVRNDIGNIYRSTFYKIYTPPLVVLSKDQKTTFLLHQTYLSFLSQVPFLPSLSFLVHFVDENRGHYIANPNHALFFRELPQNYHTYAYVCIVWSLQNLVISWTPLETRNRLSSWYCFPFAKATSSPWPHTGTHLCLCHACLQLLQLFCTHLVEQQEMAGTSIDLSKATHL